ncbi:PIN domain-containing protein [uncultured Capnocytophaga sp.]|uniref:type II toxin-antitoxin system VapC family toxin n=1 Tax=uncultured Capnocytophaga sp. TaxID=159273 RepID=UPI002620E7F9|nr:PIN domain-containing protein [uncultured Capnocytophaga sp.]
MKYFLDTNIIIILFEGRYNELRPSTLEILSDTENSFYASSISLLEIAQIYRKKRFENIDYNIFNKGDKLLAHILEVVYLVKILPFEQKQAFVASCLEFVPKHNDPNDLAIIAHAITENMPIISCDDKFPAYQAQGAKVIHNPR